MTRIMVAGIGSPHGQDIAGWLVIDKLEKNFSPRLSSLVECFKLQTPMDFIDRIELSPNGLELKAERREPSGENYANSQTFHHLPECLRTSASTHSTPFEFSPAANCNMQQTWILVDACLGLDAGAVQRWTWPEIPNEPAARSSTHALGLIDTIRLAESLGILSKQVWIYGVSTEDLQASVDRCAELIRSDLAELLA